MNPDASLKQSAEPSPEGVARGVLLRVLLLCCAALLALLIVDALFPTARVYERIAGVLHTAFPPPAAPAR